MNRRSFFSRACTFLSAPFVAKATSFEGGKRDMVPVDVSPPKRPAYDAGAGRDSIATSSVGKADVCMRKTVLAVLEKRRRVVFCDPRGAVTITLTPKVSDFTRVLFSTSNGMVTHDLSDEELMDVENRDWHAMERQKAAFRWCISRLLQNPVVADSSWSEMPDAPPITREMWDQLRPEPRA